jgi:hypothetical protein
MANERLAQYNTFQENHLGFKGIIAGVADELIPDGYVPDMENLKITVEGIASAIPNPNVMEPPTDETDLKAIFVWQKDDGTNVLMAQYGVHLFKWTTQWEQIFKGTPADDVAFATTAKASFAAGMGNKVYIAQEATHVMSYDGATLVELWNGPMGKYITLWKNRLFVGAVTHFYGLSASTTGHGTETDASSNGMVIWSNIWTDNAIPDDMHGGATHDNGWYTGSIIDLRTPENSACTGLLPVEENLLMFTASAIFSFSGYAESNFALFDYYHGANTPKNNAVVTAGGVFYVSKDGFYQLGKEPRKISEIVSPLTDPSDTIVSCAYHDGRVWFLTGGTLVALNVSTGSWEKYRLGGLYGTHDVGTQNIIYAADYLYIGTDSGHILIEGVSNSLTPGYRPWYLRTPVLNQGITSANKRYKTMFIYAKNTSDTMEVSYSPDYGSNISIFPSVVGSQSGDRWGTMLWGNDLTVAHTPAQEVTASHGHWSAANADMTIYKREVIYPVARTIKFTFEGTGEGALLGYAIVYTPKRKYGVR